MSAQPGRQIPRVYASLIDYLDRHHKYSRQLPSGSYYRCLTCPHVFTSRLEWSRHLNKIHKVIFKCGRCDKTHVDLRLLGAHLGHSKHSLSEENEKMLALALLLGIKEELRKSVAGDEEYEEILRRFSAEIEAVKLVSSMPVRSLKVTGPLGDLNINCPPETKASGMPSAPSTDSPYSRGDVTVSSNPTCTATDKGHSGTATGDQNSDPSANNTSVVAPGEEEILCAGTGGPRVANTSTDASGTAEGLSDSIKGPTIGTPANGPPDHFPSSNAPTTNNTIRISPGDHFILAKPPNVNFDALFRILNNPPPVNANSPGIEDHRETVLFWLTFCNSYHKAMRREIDRMLHQDRPSQDSHALHLYQTAQRLHIKLRTVQACIHAATSLLRRMSQE